MWFSPDRSTSCRFGRLGYRTVYWDWLSEEGDHQGAAQVNHPDLSEPFTRVLEHKHFAPWEEHKRTLVSMEYSKETGENDTPYYPKRLAADKTLLAGYVELAKREERVSFLGRLATYRYMDMHHVIGEALDFAPVLGAALGQDARRPVFPAEI
jgi:UDP-galactopyranose mutase